MWWGTTEVMLGSRGQRSLFAVLAARPNSVFSLDRLVDALWGHSAPKTAEGCVYTYVSALRKALDQGWRHGRLHSPLVRGSTGYCLELDPEVIDLVRFEVLAGQAWASWTAGELPAAAARSQQALLEYVDIPLAGTTGPFVDKERDRLGLLRLEMDEIRCGSMIELGSSAAVVRDLTVLAAEHPLRERLHEFLMVALYRSGRQAEALRVYQQVRGVLLDELGVEPGPCLQKLHQDVLSGAVGEPRLRASVQWQRPVPAQLPHSAVHFIGRDEEIRQAVALATSASNHATGMPILAVDGIAGVGKTAFAVQLARQLSASFPDGQLFVDLRGFDPQSRPLTPGDALEHLLRSLGASPDELRMDEVGKTALLRSLLADRRMLVVLDNAYAADQVRPLLPGTSNCLVIVTSRDRLAGLVARDGGTRITVEILKPDQALQLLEDVLGVKLQANDLEPARELIELCGRLPLALRVAAERLHAEDHQDLRGLVDQLTDSRLDGLSASGDDRAAVRSVFSTSYQALSPGDALVFRLLGLHPATEFGLADGAALVGVDAHLARQSLGSLARRHLLQPIAGGRYRLHDLLRVFALERAELEEDISAIREAVERLVMLYTNEALAARTILAPGLDPAITARPCLNSSTSYHEALACANARLPALIDVLRASVERGIDQAAADLATAAAVLCHSTSRWADWVRVIDLGLEAARRSGDSLSEGRLANDAGLAYHFLGRHDDAIASHRRAVEILDRLDVEGADGVRSNLLVAYQMLGRLTQDVPLLSKAMRMAKLDGNRLMEGAVSDSLGAALSGLGRSAEAIDHGHRAVVLFREEGADHLLAHALTQVGDSCLRAGRVGQAVEHFETALTLWRNLGDQWGQTEVGDKLAEACARSGGTP
jgi:DNA-binding SARP family transcriptional activator